MSLRRRPNRVSEAFLRPTADSDASLLTNEKVFCIIRNLASDEDLERSGVKCGAAGPAAKNFEEIFQNALDKQKKIR